MRIEILWVNSIPFLRSGNTFYQIKLYSVHDDFIVAQYWDCRALDIFHGRFPIDPEFTYNLAILNNQIFLGLVKSSN